MQLGNDKVIVYYTMIEPLDCRNELHSLPILYFKTYQTGTKQKQQATGTKKHHD